MEVSDGIPALAAVVLLIALLILSTRYLDRRTDAPMSTDAPPTEAITQTSRTDAKKAAREKKVDEKAPAPGCADMDIEDLTKSLVPETMRRMKKEGVTPYSLGEKRSMLDELEASDYPRFGSVVARESGGPLKRTHAKVFQINIGLHCNQACSHCHVDSSPRRKEMMNRATADRCLELIRNSPSIEVVDLTGGAPEMCREFRYVVAEVRKLGREVIDRRAGRQPNLRRTHRLRSTGQRLTVPLAHRAHCRAAGAT